MFSMNITVFMIKADRSLQYPVSTDQRGSLGHKLFYMGSSIIGHPYEFPTLRNSEQLCS